MPIMQTAQRARFPQVRSSHRPVRDRLWVLGSLVEFIVTGRQSQGEYIMLDVTTWPGFGPPPHSHENESECFYILDGEFEMLVGEEKVRAQKGDRFFVPPGTVHTFKCVSRLPGRFITIVVGEGLEHFFREVGAAVEDPSVPPTFGSDLEQVIDSAKRNGMTVLI
jgi:quercetin dioxygenase-like cupin family protein